MALQVVFHLVLWFDNTFLKAEKYDFISKYEFSDLI